MSYIKSESITMYPSALRGGTDSNNNVTIYNPESRLNSEFNITNPVNRLTIDGSFVIGLDNNNLEFSIHGYYFKINDITQFNSLNDGEIWASIKLTSLSQESGSWKLLSLSSWSDSTNLDIDNNNIFEFTGLDITQEEKTGTNIYSLHILDKAKKVYTIPKASYLKFDPNTIKINNDTALADIIYEVDDKINIAADEFTGHLTGNVTGDLDGNAKTATDANYSAAIGTAANHPAIGNEKKPVYIDNNGVIKTLSATVGSYSNPVYLEAGEIKPSFKININNRAPVDGQDAGNEGDIWFQYVG